MDFSIDGTRSVNPEVDLGQVEGALIFGLGLWTTEKVVYDKNTGQLLTAGTWVCYFRKLLDYNNLRTLKLLILLIVT